MTIDDLCRSIELDSFTTRLTPTSVVERFVEFASQQAEVEALAARIRDDSNDALALIERLRSTALSQPDYRYRNPFDVPLACYLIAIYVGKRALFDVATRIARNAMNASWVPRVAEYLAHLNVPETVTTVSDLLPRPNVREIRSSQGPSDVPIVAVSMSASAAGTADLTTAFQPPSKMTRLQSGRQGYVAQAVPNLVSSTGSKAPQRRVS